MNKILKRTIATAGMAGVVLSVRHLSRTWGTDIIEREMPLPGDDLVTDCQVEANRAITIEVPPEKVWPWLTQIGQDRAGFYSYEKLENLIGCEIMGSEKLTSQWSERHVGDSVHLTPDVSLQVAIVEPQHALVLFGGSSESMPAEKGLPESFTWQFVLEPHSEGTRVLVRERYKFSRKRDLLLSNLVILSSVIMTEKMLRTIKMLAENR